MEIILYIVNNKDHPTLSHHEEIHLVQYMSECLIKVLRLLEEVASPLIIWEAAQLRSLTYPAMTGHLASADNISLIICYIDKQIFYISQHF